MRCSLLLVIVFIHRKMAGKRKLEEVYDLHKLTIPIDKACVQGIVTSISPIKKKAKNVHTSKVL